MIRDEIKEWTHNMIFDFLYNIDYGDKPRDCKLTSDKSGDSIILEFRTLHGNIVCSIFSKKRLIESHYDLEGAICVSNSHFNNKDNYYIEFMECAISKVDSIMNEDKIDMNGEITSEVVYYTERDIDDISLEKYYNRSEDYDMIYFEKNKKVYKEKIKQIVDLPNIILDDILINNRIVLVKIYGHNDYLDINMEYYIYIKKCPSIVGTDQITIFAHSSGNNSIRDVNTAFTLFEKYDDMISKKIAGEEDDNYIVLKAIITKAVSSVFDQFALVTDGKPKYKIYMA